MSVIVGWIISSVLSWLANCFATHIAAYEKSKSEHADEIAKANQDMHKADAITAQSSMRDQEDAAEDALKHF